jgi:phospholipase/lecithinase/hemolysin
VYLCNPTTAGACRNASSYVFFDAVHPSEAANVFMAESMIEAGIELVT